MGGSEAGGNARSQQSLLALLDDRLRGRWLWMLGVGGVLAIVFAILGYASTSPMYQSQGAIRVAPNLNPLINAIPETGQMPHYQSFMQTQVQYIRSRRVIEHALKNEELRALEWSRNEDVLSILESELEAWSDRRSELIFVSFESAEPVVCQTVCRAIIESYDEIYGREGGDATFKKLQELDALQAQFERDLRVRRGNIQTVHARHRTMDLQALHGMKSQQIEVFEQQIAAASAALARDGGTPGGETRTMAGPGTRQLEAISPRLAELRALRDQAITDFEMIRDRYRPGTNVYVRAEGRVETAERMLRQEHARALEQWVRLSPGTLAAAGDPAFFDGMGPDRLATEIEALKAGRAAASGEIEQLLADIQLLADTEFEVERIQSDLADVKKRKENLELERNSIASRISVVQEATTPHAPYRDGRGKRAIAGFVFGFAASFGVFFLLGTVDRRTYGTGQLRLEGARETRCLGVLPDLGRGLEDPETSDIASHCVHQIRNQIEVMREPDRGFALAVTSPFQGDGKTSIVMALGWSYALAGYRTLLVDCDMVGRSLTRQLGLIGEPGLKEALFHHESEGVVTDLPVENLSVMPVGADARFGPETLRHRDLSDALDVVRERYEMVIVDTGPLLGSLESTPVTTAADGVVLSIRRGRSRTRLEECMRRLQAAGARCLGMILNCVDRTECSRYVSEASLAFADHDRGESGPSVMYAANGERNLLMLAMEGPLHQRDDDPPEVRQAS
jgi:Mrp family chromosome partitioning ATPase/uncharacterized protein involved in exopolysaccharide biosynthesis